MSQADVDKRQQTVNNREGVPVKITIIVLLALTLAVPAAYARKGPGKQHELKALTVVDSLGQTVGRYGVTPVYNGNGAFEPAVFLTVNDVLVAVPLTVAEAYTANNRLNFKAVPFGGGVVVFQGQSCLGTPYAHPDYTQGGGVRVNVTVRGAAGHTILFMASGEPTGNVTVASTLVDGGGCQVLSPASSTQFLPLLPPVDLNQLYTPPLTIR